MVRMATTKMCFVAGTPIQTADGWRPIEAIKPGDSVWSRSQETGEVACRPIISTAITHPTTLHHVVYRAGNARRAHAVGAMSAVASGEDGGSDNPPGPTSTLICTGEHPFFVQEKQDFVEARSLAVGYHLVLADGTSATVVGNTVESAPEGQTFITYNFEVAEFHTYFAGVGGVWVHNAGRDCERIFTIYERLKQRGKTAQEAFGEIAKKLPDTVKNREAMGTALSEAIKTDVLPNRTTPVWTKGPEANPGANAWRHFNDHGAEVGAVDAITFVQKAIAFTDQAVGANIGVLKIGKRVKNGVDEMVFLNLNTGEFAVKVVSGAESGGLKTFFVRQNNRAKYFMDQLAGGGLELQ